jgi:glutamyl-tRNA synthetase
MYVHVPLALNTSGQRLAKRDGAVTPAELSAAGIDVTALIADSLGLPAGTPRELLEAFDPAAVPAEPWVFQPPPAP